MKHKHKTVKLTGEALAKGKVFVAAQREYMAAIDALEEQQQKELEALSEQHHSKLKVMFNEVAELAGIEPDDGWHMDTEYMDEHGDLFLGKCDHERRGRGPLGLDPEALSALFEKQLKRPREH
jgi:hypothetical protein